MKKNIILILVALAMFSCSSNKFQIKGTIEGATDQTIYLAQIIDNQFVTIDSTTLTNGSFIFKGNIDMVDIYAVQLQNPPEQIVLFLENATVTIKGSVDNVTGSEIKGSKAHDLYLSFEALQTEISQPLMEIEYQYQAAAMDGSLTPELEAQIISDYESETAKYIESIKDFVIKNSNSPVAAYITLAQLLIHLTTEELEHIVSKFPSKIHASPFVANLIERLETEKKTSIGQPYIDFTLTSHIGEEISFSSVVGKNYVLLDFWAGWCTPCRRENPLLVELYKKYSNMGFDIFGVSLDHNRQQWIDAISKDGLLWAQVSDLSGWESSIAKLYGIMSIPANLLIAPTGEIVAKNLRASELEEKLQELLNL